MIFYIIIQMRSHNNKNLVVGDQIFYRPKGDLLMEVVEVGGLIKNKWVNLVDVSEFERNNRVVDGMRIIQVSMKTANTFWRKQEKRQKLDDNKIEYSRVLCDEDLVVGDQIFYSPKGDLLMEVVQVGGLINKKWVNLVDVEEFERNNKVLNGMKIMRVSMITAKTFLRKQLKK